MVVLPTYNEAGNLANMVGELFALGLDLEVLVVDDNSPDGTGRIADELSAQHPGKVHVMHREGKLGLGTAYVAGFKFALERGVDRIVQMDADFSHAPDRLPVFLSLIEEEGCDVVVGSRYVAGGKLDEKWGFWRRFLSGMGNRYAALVTGLPQRDVTAGFKCYTREALSALPLDQIRSNGYAFQIEVSFLCHRAGLSVRESPIHFEDRVIGNSKMSTAIILEAMWRVWQIIWRYR